MSALAVLRGAFIFTTSLLLFIRVSFATPLLLDSANKLAVDLAYGTYRGTCNVSTNLNVWKGVRYAAAPLGPLRWRAPQLPNHSRGETINATAFGPTCPQSSAAAPVSTFYPGNEDCLFLNVYAPVVHPGVKLPVLVWIHGGGYGAGSGRQDMSEIINANNNTFIAVTVQYRLGAFGFLSSADVQGDGVVNAGILDQAFALQWVQSHIGKFGGDPRRVTVSGESAGGGSVMLLGIAHGGTLDASLFQNAIAASPYLPPQYDYNASIPTRRYLDFADEAGCGNSTAILACLRGQNSTTLQSAYHAVNNASFYGNWAFLPVTDYEFVTDLPSSALAAKRVNGYHILVGNNADEGSSFVPHNINTTSGLQSWLIGAFPNLDDSTIERIMNVYIRNESTIGFTFATTGQGPSTALTTSPVAHGLQQLAYNIYAEATFVCPSYWLSDAFTRDNRTSFHYQYSIPVALHGRDVSAYFGPATINQPPVFTSEFRRMWGLHIERAAPSAAVAPEVVWPAWVEGATSRMLNLNVTGGVPYETVLGSSRVMQYEDPGLQIDFRAVNAKTWEGGRGDRCAFWKEVARLVPM